MAIKDRVEQLVVAAALVGGLAAAFSIGYSIGKDTNEGTVSILREKAQALEKSNAMLTSENTAIKLELQKSQSSPQHKEMNSKEMVAAEPGLQTDAKINAEPNSSAHKFTVQKNQSAELFDGQVIVSLIATPFEGDPLRNKVVATVGGPGKSSAALDKVDVGYAVQYGSYELRVLAADTFTATFSVTQLAGKP